MSIPSYFRYSAYSQSFIPIHQNRATSNTTLYFRSDWSDDHINSSLDHKYSEVEDVTNLKNNLTISSTLYKTNVPLYKIGLYDEETIYLIDAKTNEISFTLKKGYRKKDSINVWSGTNIKNIR